MLLRQEQINGVWEVEYSFVIKESTKYGLYYCCNVSKGAPLVLQLDDDTKKWKTCYSHSWRRALDFVLQDIPVGYGKVRSSYPNLCVR
jgi:hypothetical protein